MSKFNLFARLAKFDEETGIFEAVAADESIDKAQERFHYESSKPHFADWSQAISKATEGKSVGNVRSMHGKNACGKLTELTMDDAAKSILVRGQVVDPVDRLKMAAGVYTGVSIGGSYAKRWDDPDNAGVKWYTAVPAEISIVDNPCNGNAHFTMVKADGATAEVELLQGEAAKARAEEIEKSAAASATSQDTPPEEPDPSAAAADPETAAVNEMATLIGKGITAARTLELIKAEIATTAAADNDARIAELRKALERDDLKNRDVEDLALKYLGADAAMGTPDELMAKLEEMAKREFSQEARDKAADSGAALPDGSFPIKTKADLANAVKAYGRAKNKAAAKKHIIERAKSLGATDELPDDWKDSEKALALDEFADSALAKDMYTVSCLARLLDELRCIVASSTFEAAAEGDGSPVPARLKMACDELGMILCEMCDEETGEMADADKAALADALQKAGARHSKADLDRLQAIHDHSVGMGAQCASEKLAPNDALAKRLNVPVDTLDAAIEKLLDKAKKWDELPAPTKGRVRIVAREDDSSEQTNDANKAREDEIKRAVESGDPLALTKVIQKYGAIPGYGSNAPLPRLRK